MSRQWLKLFFGFCVSEFGGYLTNTVILFYLFDQTEGSKFVLGLAQILFVGPLALGGFLGGPVGESFDRRKVMIFCEFCNFLVLGLVTLSYGSLWVLIALRGMIVFFAGMYNPSRQAILRELVPTQNLTRVNAWFTSAYALFHSVGPILGAMAYKNFGGVREIFLLNVLCYAVSVGLLLSLKVSQPRPNPARASLFKQFKEGLKFVFQRPDLAALLRNFSVGGFCLGVFFPTCLPFLSEVYHADKALYGQMMMLVGVGGILGGFISPWLLRRFARGQILVVGAVMQALVLLLWTQTNQLWISFPLIFIWGVGILIFTSTYINYIQMEVDSGFQARAFSIYDNSMSLSVISGAALVSLVGNALSAKVLLGLTAGFALAFLLATLFTRGIRALYKMEAFS